jgi:hypothetical protein
MRRKRSWVVWCVVVVVALLALAAPGLPVLGADNSWGYCNVLNEDGIPDSIYARIQTWGDPGAYTRVVCRGSLDTYDPTKVPTSFSGDQAVMTCDILNSFNWYETISPKGKVTLTCYPGN